LRLRNRREVDAELFRLPQHVFVERRRRLDAKAATTAASLLRPCRQLANVRAERLERVDEFFWRGWIGGDAHRGQLDVRIEVEGRRHGAGIARVDAVDRVEHHRGILNRATDRADAVLRPGEHHSAGATHAAERRTK
jgi:hypothetical protein